MTREQFLTSLTHEQPPAELAAPLRALWWDAKSDWTRAHDLVNDLETNEAMAVHAYLHRKEGDASNAGYWYRRAGRRVGTGTLEAEWRALVKELLSTA